MYFMKFIPTLQISWINSKECKHRGVVPGGAMALPDFGRSVNSTKGGRLCPPSNTGTTGFSDLPILINEKFNNS